MNLTTINGCLTLVLMLSVALTSCDSTEEPPIAEGTKLEFEQIIVQYNLDADTNSKSSFEVKLEFPQLNKVDSSLLKTIIQQESYKVMYKSVMSDTILTSQEQVIAELQNAYDAFKSDFPEINSKWFLNRTFNVIYQNEKYVSLMSHEHSYLGGSHSNELMVFKNFHIATGNYVSLSQILSSLEYKKAEELAETEFRKQKGLKSGDNLSANGWYFPNGKFTLNNNFYLTDSSIIIRYNTYDIGSYAAGATSLEVRWEDIKKKEA